MDRLLNKSVVITGATKGIGRSLALQIAHEGGRVAIGGRSAKEGESLAREIRAGGGEAIFVQGDIASEECCREIVEKAVEKFGRLDGLVNNAGIFPEVPFYECDGETFDRVYAVNARGAFLCSKYAAMQMEKNGGGSIVHIGSTHAFGASPNYAIYGTSKGAMYSLSDYLAKNLAKKRIRSNWITVGWVATDGEMERVINNGHDMDWLDGIGRETCPLGGLQSCEDIGYGVIYLLSDESRMVTQTSINITGGFVPGH